ncbi:cellulose binding domain-containing protein [Gynuella sunshinyii]|uniref:Cellobiohydrolase A (1,4-beta-cellobiosidase A) n=1 Tax=Gynuella sunshinyii YC6258 TaxID=1445510 RepID=A0A0C5VNC1_9GAMM|nr:cellulose binding domain-containing protein [Gynuella sunshinyii]AJQ96197.1 cellobiohydrolase A (1,4-beta-cellobiosidase A) [Gynuella sunshinyii YC6258]
MSVVTGFSAAKVSGTGEAVLTVQNDWGSGYCANVVITNHGDADIDDWNVTMDFKDSSVVSLWNATLSDNSVTSVDHNSTIIPGGSVSFGFCANINGPDYPAEIVSLEVNGGGSTPPDDGGGTGQPDGSCPSSAENAYQMYFPSIPDRVEAENFDVNGFSDTTPENQDGAYRPDSSVDIKAISGGYAVGWMAPDEWLEYTIYVAYEDDYDVTIRSGAAGTGSTLSLSQCGNSLIDTFNVPSVSAWGQFKTVSAGKIHLKQGMQKFRVTVGNYLDLDWIHIGPYEGDPDAGTVPEPVACTNTGNSSSATSITVDGNHVRSGNVNGLTFKGFGVLSANGTSALLMDYKSQHPEKYAELLKILFGGPNPIMTHVKIEMGNDRNNSTGPDPATMRTANESANVRRAPGFQLAADARKINPNLKVSILRWNAPGWVTNNDQVYTWFKNTILAAYREYGYMVDYVNPGVNERGPDLNWTKQYESRIKSDSTGFQNSTERDLYNRIKIVISDEAGLGSFGGAMVSDASLRNAAPVAAYHYNTDDDSAGNFTRLAEQYDLEVWNSEAQATFSNSAFRPNNNVRDPSVSGTGIGGINGPLEMGNTVIKGFYKSRRTHFIYQPAIGSFYEGGQYAFKELLSARDPWSGWIHYDAGLQVLRHFSWFANAGWENSNNSAGIWRVIPESSYTGATGTNPVNGRNGSPSYMTLAAPDKQDFSTVFVNDSEYTKTYRLKVDNMDFSEQPVLELWETRAADSGEAFNRHYMQYQCNLSADSSGSYNITVKPYSVLTVTSLENIADPAFHTPLPVEGERTVLDTDATGAQQDSNNDMLYADDFDYSSKTVPVIGNGGEIAGIESYVAALGGSKSVMPRYFSDRNGAFEAYLPEGSDNYVLRQQLDQSIMGLGGTWNNGSPITGVGDGRWLNYKASVDVAFENSTHQINNNYAGIGARQQGGSNSHFSEGTPYILKILYDGSWLFQVDAVTVASGNVVTGAGGVRIDGFDSSLYAWHNLALQVVNNHVTAYLDNVKLAEYTDANPRLSGRVNFLSGYYHTRFDNLKVEKVSGYPPYYSELLDNMEIYDLQSNPNEKLIYGGNWSHANGKSMYNYQRSLSVNQGAGATLEYTFDGTGVDILGPNNGSAVLEVTLDGQVVNGSAGTSASKEFYQTYTLRGLSSGVHTVKFRVLSGTLVVDAVAVVQ